MKNKQTELPADKIKTLNPGIRGESIDKLAKIESANNFLAEKEISQQRENL